MRITSLTIQSSIKNYEVSFQENEAFIASLSELEDLVFIVDKNVWELHQNGCLRALKNKKVIVQEAAEDLKNITTVCELYEKIMSYAPKKNITIVSIGGGIIQDITGFVTSSLYRGVKWIFIPTTLLAQVDSCIGSKTSLNFKQYKNLIGTFYPPSQIYIYTEFLKTLTQEDYYSGIGEMAKLHLIEGDAATSLFIKNLPKIDRREDAAVLEQIHACLKIKKAYIESDEFDSGRRNMLNYGHCFGHAIESATQFKISHGQAVVVGMILANEGAKKRGVLSSENEIFIREKVLIPSLKVAVPKIDSQKTIDAMRQDKKNTGKGLALIVLKDGYNMEKISDLTSEEAKEILESVSF